MNKTKNVMRSLQALMLSALACMMLMVILPDPAMAAIKYSGTCGTNLTWTLDDKGLLTISGSGAMKEYGDKDKEWNITDKRWKGTEIGDKVQRIVVEEGVTSIGSDAFYYLQNCTSVEIPSTVKTIGKGAFYHTYKLTKVTYHGSTSDWANAVGKVTTGLSKSVIVECLGALSVETLPEEIMIPTGETASVTIKASSADGDIDSYTWYFKDPGSDRFLKAAETSDTYSFRMTEEKSGRILYCVVKDTAGNESASTHVLFRAPKTLAITKQPVDITGGMNTKNTFSLEAEGEGLTYAWYYQNEKGKYEHASTNPARPTYTTTFLAKRNNRKLYCIVTDQFGNTVKSNTVQIHVDPLITKQPVTTYGASGKLVKFTCEAQGEGLTYHWFYRSPDRRTFTQSTQTGSVYTTRALYDRRQIYCEVTNAAGVTSKSDVVQLYVGQPTVITNPLTDVTAQEGKQAKFSLGVTGDGLKFTWYYKSVGRTSFTRSNETDATYVTKATMERDGRQIYCVVSDSHGIVLTTPTVTLHVIPQETEELAADTLAPETETPAETEAVSETETPEETESVEPETETPAEAEAEPETETEAETEA